MRPRLVTYALIFACSLSVATARAEAGEEPRVAGRLGDIAGTVGPGSTVTIVDNEGRKMRGRITELSDSELQLLVNDQRRTFRESDVSLITAKHTDNLANGLIIGAAVGAFPVIVLGLALDRNEFDEYGPAIAAYAGVGAAIGLAVDAWVRGERPIFVAQRPQRSVSIAPVVSRSRQGVAVTVKF